jgi:hypothetical protein
MGKNLEVILGNTGENSIRFLINQRFFKKEERKREKKTKQKTNDIEQ